MCVKESDKGNLCKNVSEVSNVAKIHLNHTNTLFLVGLQSQLFTS